MAGKTTRINYFHPQAFLMYASSIKNATKKAELKPERSSISVFKIRGKYNPTGVMSRIHNGSGQNGKSKIKDNFFNLETHKISSLIPELRFYKVSGQNYRPFYFPISTLSEDVVSMDSPSRLGAAAVKTFNVTYEGTDPFTAPKYLKADVQLYVDNLQNIFAEPPESGYARLADMFTISIAQKGKTMQLPGGGSIPSGDLSRPIEVAATLGYTISDRSLFTQEEIQEIRSSNISLRMNVFSHSINIEQNGAATIDISYTARIDNAGRDRMFSAIDAPEDIVARADVQQLLAPEKSKANEIKKIKTADAIERKRQKMEKKILECRRIMEILDEKKQIFSLKVKPTEVLEYASFGIPKALSDKAQSMSRDESLVAKVKSQDLFQALEGVSDDPAMKALFGGTAQRIEDAPPSDFLNKAANLKKKLDEMDSSSREIYYVTFGHLIEAFMQKVKENLEKAIDLISKSNTKAGKKRLEEEDMGGFLKKSEDEKKKIVKTIDESIKKLPTFKVLLADFTYKHYTGTTESKEEVKRMNIADIPISLFTYQKFMYDSVVNSNRISYVVPQFLENCIRSGGLLDKALQEWSHNDIAPNIISAFPEFTSNTFSGPQMRTSVFGGGKISPSKIPSGMKTFTASQVDDECDYYLIHQSPTKELTQDKSGRKEQDRNRGIYHFHIGKNRGLFKSISFSRIDVPFVQEQLMTNQVGMYDELKMVYNANIEMVGNNLFMPGTEIFVDPGSIGFGNPADKNSAAYRLGLGGYYTVIGVSTSVSNGVATTSLTCTHLAHPTERPDDVEADERPPKANILPTARSQDSIALQGAPDIGEEKEMPKPEYYKELASLMLVAPPLEPAHVMDERLALAIATDYHTVASERADRIPGVVSRQYGHGSKDDTAIYHLSKYAVSVKIDSEGVSLIRNSKTHPGG